MTRCMCVCMCVYIYIYIYIHTHTHTHNTHTHTHTYIYIYIIVGKRVKAKILFFEFGISSYGCAQLQCDILFLTVRYENRSNNNVLYVGS